MKNIFIVSLGFFMILMQTVFGQEDSSFSSEALMHISKINIQGQSDVQLEQTDTPFLRFSNPDMVEVSIENDCLYLKTAGEEVFLGLTNYSQINIEGITALKSKGSIKSNFLQLIIEGAASVELELETDSLVTDIDGAAEVSLEGVSRIHHLQIDGAAVLKAEKLQTKKTRVNIDGIAKATVYTTEEISGSISGLSQLNYKGNPKQIKLQADETAKLLGFSLDTSLYKIGPNELYIIDDIEGNEKNPIDKNIVIKRKKKFNGHWGGIELGWNLLSNNDYGFSIPNQFNYLEQNFAKSNTVNINLIEKNVNIIKNKFGFLTGLGLQYQNYRFKNNVFLSGDSTLLHGYFDTDETKSYVKSKLVVNYLTLPLIFEYQTNSRKKSNSFHLSAGAILGLRIGSHSKNVYYDNNKQKIKEKDDFHLNPFKAELTCRIGWSRLNFFANYSMTSLFESGKAPGLYPFTVGLALLSW